MNAAFVRYLGLRTMRAALTVWAVISLVFLMIHLVPGDPVDVILGDQASPEDRADLRRTLRLDQPLLSQYGHFLSDVADGSLGNSFRQRQASVASLLREAMPHTAWLALSSLAFALALAIPLGAVAALKRGRLGDRVATTAAMLGIAIPNIWLGPLLVLGFGVQLQLLPMPGSDSTTGAALILPTITVGTALMAILARQTRGALIEVLSEPYIQAARARGLSPATVLFRHALRNALMPVITVAAAQLGALLSGAVITEKIFERPGLGTLFLEAFFDRDIPVVQGCVLVIALIYVTVNLLVDLFYVWIDPRVRLA
ncbi:MAG: ABC transporter permease [Myxococcales bacterium]|nr:ABC transporter permease [Myxococcales bacterium]MDD9967143.1 ABC transporter permease [Myxococcales bacterium]